MPFEQGPGLSYSCGIGIAPPMTLTIQCSALRDKRSKPRRFNPKSKGPAFFPFKTHGCQANLRPVIYLHVCNSIA